MKNKKLYILLIVLFYSFNLYAETTDIINQSNIKNYTTNSNSNINFSNRIIKNDNSNSKSSNSLYVPYKPEFYELKDLENQDNITSNIFESPKNNYLHHIFRGPMASININSAQDIVNGYDINIKTKGKIGSSISGSYLYGLTPRFRLGPEIMHTTYDNKANISINDTFSLMIRSEFVFYKTKTLELYSVAGVGLSFNTLNLIYTRLIISTSTSTENSFNEYIIKPLVNGSSVASDSAYFYCSIYPRFNNLKIDVIVDPKDPMKKISVFNGDGFGICVYQNADKTKNASIQYQEFLTPEKATSIPWFIGMGVDYNLRPVISKLMDFNSVDYNFKSKSEVGVSLGIRYFNNGDSTVKYKTTKSVDQYTVKYKGFFSLNLSLFMKL